MHLVRQQDLTLARIEQADRFVISRDVLARAINRAAENFLIRGIVQHM